MKLSLITTKVTKVIGYLVALKQQLVVVEVECNILWNLSLNVQKGN
jgi:hypothetical protein